MRATGKDQWAAGTLALVDRSRYLREDGVRMSDAEVLDVLRAAWDTISSDSANKTAPSAFRTAARGETAAAGPAEIPLPRRAGVPRLSGQVRHRLDV